MDTTTAAPRAAADRDIQRAIVEELEWSPQVEATHIGVAVDDGVVTLSGELASAAERIAAKRAAMRVRGVRAIADELRVHVTEWDTLSDADIAANAAAALERSSDVPPGAVQVSVHDGAVTLSGTVPWDFQRTAARNAVEHLGRVSAVHDWIALNPRPSAAGTEERIRDALVRNAVIDADAVHVSMDGSTARLDGSVRSFAEKREAVRAAWSSPHVTAVVDHLRIV